MKRRKAPEARIDPPFKAPARPLSTIDVQTIHCCDNVDLIYIDPPFNSNRVYETFWGETKEKRAFEDRHESTRTYIEYMRPRCVQLARVLKKTGSLYYHCDWHASHYVKVMLDQIMGEDNFQSEIIWKRTTSHGNVGRNFGALTDSIFFYTASKSYTWNQQYRPLSPEYIAQRFRLPR
jgi:adenine specific DNA methylase Mod